MLKKDEKQLQELKEAEASKKIAEEIFERYQKGLEDVKVEPKPKADKQEKNNTKNEDRKASVGRFI